MSFIDNEKAVPVLKSKVWYDYGCNKSRYTSRPFSLFFIQAKNIALVHLLRRMDHFLDWCFQPATRLSFKSVLLLRNLFSLKTVTIYFTFWIWTVCGFCLYTESKLLPCSDMQKWICHLIIHSFQPILKPKKLIFVMYCHIRTDIVFGFRICNASLLLHSCPVTKERGIA